MKLVLTKDEMEVLVRNHYALPSETVIEISKPKKIKKSIPDSYYKFRDRFGDTMTSHEKIPAIKALREIAPNLRLWGAKWAVENFEKVTDHVMTNKAWPEVANDRCFKFY